MTFLYPLCILILLICMTGGIVSFYYEPRKPIVGYREHEQVTMLSSDMFVKNVMFCRACGDTDLSGNCFPKLFFTNCDIRVGLDDATLESILYCHNHRRETKNAYQCHCRLPSVEEARKYVSPRLIP